MTWSRPRERPSAFVAPSGMRRALLLLVIVDTVVPKWHTVYPPRSPVCEPYPGCPAPDVEKRLCPYTWLGEMCTMVKKATNMGVPSDALIVEVGSAFGYGMWIARHFGHPILGFECRGDEYERLRKQFEDDPHVKVVNACVADKPGFTKFYRAGDSSSMLEGAVAKGPGLAKRISENSTVEEARIVTLDEMLSVVDVLKQPIGIITIDVQGAEPDVLRGAMKTIRAHRPLIMYEDTELSWDLKIGKLLPRLLGEAFGREAQRWYQPCHCERDCMCEPHVNTTHPHRAHARWKGKSAVGM